MHELSIAMSILDSVEAEVTERGCGTIDAVHVRIGLLSGVVPDALRSAYELALEQAGPVRPRLVIEEAPIVIHCAVCGCDREVRLAEWFCCPDCGTQSAEVVGGRELEISGLELAA